MSIVQLGGRLLTAALLAMCLAAHADMNDSTSAAPMAIDLSRELKKARGLIEQQRYADAIKELKAAEQIDPTNANVHNWLGYSYRKSGNLDAAFKSYGTALKLDPKHKGAHEYIGEAYLTAKQPDKAREHLAALKTICGTGCEEYRDLDKAIAAYKP